mgnify:CR=1 FL=1
MLKNYLKIGWRNLMTDKTFSVLNIIGLSIAFGVAILLSMAAFFDLSYDRFHNNLDNLYQVYSVEQNVKGQEISTSHPMPLTPSLKTEVPGVERITRYLEDGVVVSYNEKELILDGLWTDEDFLSMFTFPIIQGDSDHPLNGLSGLAITEESANKLFGSIDAVGKVVNLAIDGKDQPFTITAVVKDMLPQSTIDFDLALRLENHPSYQRIKENWGNRNHNVYLQLQKGVSVSEFEKNTQAFTNLHYKEGIDDAIRDGAHEDANGQYRQLRLLPYMDVHFTNFTNGIAKVARTYPYLILGIAFLILFIACVNFVNMGIAKSVQRVKEIGMRKTLGAQKKHLFLQFWSESLFVFLISVAFGILLSVLLLDSFKSLLQTAVSFEMVTTPTFLLSFVVFVLVITFIVGGYPALVLSKLGTIQALKGKLETNGKNRVRDLLMVVQFGIAIVLISGTLVLWSQLDFMRNKDLGFNKEQVMAFPLDGKKDSYQLVQLLREELRNNTNILSVSGSDNILGRGKDGSAYTSVLGFDYKERGVKTNMLVVDYDYTETLDLELVSGRSFERRFAADSLSVVINETMAMELGEDDPLTARIIMDDSITYSVIGVMKDYHFQGLDKAIEPITLFMNNNWDLYYAYIKIAPGNMATAVDEIKTAWTAIEPNTEFLGSFLDENVDRTFRREKVMTTMISSGSLIAIALSCIGLFAISLLVVAQRTKEIGIRKVVGASIVSLTFMLTKDFLKLVLVAFLIASPIAWWSMRQWLERYAYRIDLHPGYFIAAGVLAIIIAVLTVGARTVGAALQNPVKSLRTE